MQAELTRGDVTRQGAIPGTLRPLSEVPLFVLKSNHTHASAPRERRASALLPAAPAPNAYFVGQAPDAVRDPQTEYVDLSSHGTTSVAPPHAPASPPMRPLLPSPSTVLSSRPETVDTPPSSMELTKDASRQPAKLNLDPAGGRAQEQWSPGTTPSEIEASYFPDKQLSAMELDAKRRSLASLAAERAESAEPTAHGGSDSTAAITRRPDAPPAAGRSVAPAPMQPDQSRPAPDDGAITHPPQPEREREKRPREEEPESAAGQKKPRFDSKERARHVLQPQLDPRREEAETRAAAEASALRMRQAQVREAEEAAARRQADVERLHRGLQVHVSGTIKLRAPAQLTSRADRFPEHM